MLYPIGLAARKAGISAERLRQLIDSGQVKAIRDASGRRLVEAEALARLIRTRERKVRRAGEVVPV